MTINCRIKGQLTQIVINQGLVSDTIEVTIGQECFVFDRSTPITEMVKHIEEEL